MSLDKPLGELCQQHSEYEQAWRSIASQEKLATRHQPDHCRPAILLWSMTSNAMRDMVGTALLDICSLECYLCMPAYHIIISILTVEAPYVIIVGPIVMSVTSCFSKMRCGFVSKRFCNMASLAASLAKLDATFWFELCISCSPCSCNS